MANNPPFFSYDKYEKDGTTVVYFNHRGKRFASVEYANDNKYRKAAAELLMFYIDSGRYIDSGDVLVGAYMLSLM